MSADLLPCPWCGGCGEIDETFGSVPGWAVSCETDDCLGYKTFGSYARKADAAKAWNTRAPSADRERMEAERAVIGLAREMSDYRVRLAKIECTNEQRRDDRYRDYMTSTEQKMMDALTRLTHQDSAGSEETKS